MLTINTHEAKTQLSRLLVRVSNGEEIIIAKSGKAVAKLVPIKRHTIKRKSGIDKGKGWIADDFDSPLPEELQAYFE
ncbi:type II toxin-antitoxin system Phd/YefM family antitoxin [Desulfosarcina ovata]|uniref:Antitoxin n=2 Tax=Desulfosarcina ovata TaxID=83564 RepID=A0A5K8A5F3_9BACT|nr:type II toxin-antitoxin system Phd/YefM family antitoxin [Desulfosarcina ovata]BBO80296.1 antitoxin [Desulfosarcina ovata subsp. sediminis]BBO87686.1 antitoxin [Desulfosarcina ovata subsp. ovata]